MLPKSHRLSGRMVARVFSKGRPDRFPNLTIKSLPNRLNHIRLTVIVPKKVDNRAVVRNRLRRQVVEGLKTAIFANQKPLDITVFIHKHSEAAKIVSNLEQWLKK